jgi:putative transposase
MYSEHGIYHLYNQSINYELLFRSEENYHFFLRKARKHLSPVCDILCYCLMPDHFHFLIRVKSEGTNLSRSKKAPGIGQHRQEQIFQQRMSHAIKTMLSSYTRAFNRRYSRRGSLFKAKTKSKLAHLDFINLGEGRTNLIPYIARCFHYIHANPVEAGLANQEEEWPFSSAQDYCGIRGGTLCNQELARKILGGYL